MALPTEVLLELKTRLGPRPSKSLISDLILLAHVLIVRPHLLVCKNPEEPKKVNVDLTGHTYDGRCQRALLVSSFFQFYTSSRPEDQLGLGPVGFWTSWVLDTLGFGLFGFWTLWGLDQLGLGQVEFWILWGLDTLGLGLVGFRTI